MELKFFYVVQAILNLSLAGTHALLKLADYHMQGLSSSFRHGHECKNFHMMLHFWKLVDDFHKRAAAWCISAKSTSQASYGFFLLNHLLLPNLLRYNNILAVLALCGSIWKTWKSCSFARLQFREVRKCQDLTLNSFPQVRCSVGLQIFLKWTVRKRFGVFEWGKKGM